MKASYLLGLLYIISVAVIWSVASILVQYLYQSLEFDSPFLLTYIGTSLLMVLIPVYIIHSNRFHIGNFIYQVFTCQKRICTLNHDNQRLSQVDNDTHGQQKFRIQQDYENTSYSPTSTTGDVRLLTEDGNPLSLSNEDIDDNHNDYDNDRHLYHSNTSSNLLLSSSINNNSSNNNDHHHNAMISILTLSHLDHFKLAMKVAPFWFISNYFYNVSLQYTTITSSTVLSSTSSVFTFLFAIIWGDETFNKWKLIGVIMAVLGSTLTSMHDVAENNNNNAISNDDIMSNNQLQGDDSNLMISFRSQLWGDIAGLISAVGYGVYTVLLRSFCSDESRISMNLFLGYIGLTNSVALCPLIIPFIFSEDGNDEHNNISENNMSNNMIVDEQNIRFLSGHDISSFVLFCLIIKGLFDNVLSDYLWAKGIILTSATVATVGLGLTIPLALLSDLFIMNRADVWNVHSVFGALFVLLGFIFVNIGEEEKNEIITEDPLVDFDETLDISLS